MLRYDEPSYTGFVFPVDKYFPAWAIDAGHLACPGRAGDGGWRIGLLRTRSRQMELQHQRHLLGGQSRHPLHRLRPRRGRDRPHRQRQRPPGRRVKATEFYAPARADRKPMACSVRPAPARTPPQNHGATRRETVPMNHTELESPGFAGRRRRQLPDQGRLTTPGSPPPVGRRARDREQHRQPDPAGLLVITHGNGLAGRLHPTPQRAGDGQRPHHAHRPDRRRHAGQHRLHAATGAQQRVLPPRTAAPVRHHRHPGAPTATTLPLPAHPNPSAVS